MQFIQKNVFGLALIALAVLLGGGVAFARSSPSSPAEDSPEAEAVTAAAADTDEPGDIDRVDGSDSNDDEEGGGDDEDEVPMAPQPGTISEARAIEIATAAYTGNGKRTDIELETEKGVLVYSVEFTEKDGNEVDVKLNAKTGAVVLIESDKSDGEDDEEDDD